jgi:fatty-acyl-CoA synthase
VRDDGEEVPWDGVSTGELQVRGPWVARAYYEDAGSEQKFDDGWLRTGDIASIDERGYIFISDRAKDVIKSGGEWISSVELENHLMAHPDVLEAAVIAMPDEVVRLESVPKTSVGKFDKKVLRQRFKDWTPPA